MDAPFGVVKSVRGFRLDSLLTTKEIEAEIYALLKSYEVNCNSEKCIHTTADPIPVLDDSSPDLMHAHASRLPIKPF